ncbi:pyridoxamine 5'-phosphate oxidase family protein [Propionibacteriaceae bacterium Y1814]
MVATDDGEVRSSGVLGGEITVLDEAECRDLLHDAVIGRVAFTAAELTIHPVSYEWTSDLVVIRTRSTSMLAGAVGQQVAFEVDDIDPETGVAWSVLVRGRLEQGAPPLGDSIIPWADGPRHHVLVIAPTRLTGRAVSRPEEDR